MQFKNVDNSVKSLQTIGTTHKRLLQQIYRVPFAYKK